MNVWILRDAEPLPIDPNSPRLMRAGMLARCLAERGHDVTWFNSTFDHYQKRQREFDPGTHPWLERCKIELVQGIGYSRNGSPRRLVHNFLVGKAMERRGIEIGQTKSLRPDVVIGDLPMPESARAAVRLAQDFQVPSVVSIRDLWPDFFMDFLGPASRLFAYPSISYLERVVRTTCRDADHIVGISEDYLEWGLRKAGRQQSDKDALFPLGYSPEETDGDSTSAAALRERGVDFDKDLVVFIGSWGGTYDLRMAVEAANHLQDLDNVQVVIAGDGDQRPLVDQLRQDCSNLVTPGWLNKSEIAILLENSKVALAPYPANAPQGLPNKTFEYMSAGLWQVSTLGKEASDLLHGHELGSPVEPGDPEAFARSIRHGLSQMRSPGTRERIKAYFTRNFDAAHVYERYAQWLEEIAGSSERLSAMQR